MKIRPLHDRVVIKRLEETTKTAGGIIIPDTAKEKPSEGIVEAVGNGLHTEDGKIIPMSVKINKITRISPPFSQPNVACLHLLLPGNNRLWLTVH